MGCQARNLRLKRTRLPGFGGDAIGAKENGSDGAIAGAALASVDCPQSAFQAVASLPRDWRIGIAVDDLVIQSISRSEPSGPVAIEWQQEANGPITDLIADKIAAFLQPNP